MTQAELLDLLPIILSAISAIVAGIFAWRDDTGNFLEGVQVDITNRDIGGNSQMWFNVIFKSDIDTTNIANGEVVGIGVLAFLK